MATKFVYFFGNGKAEGNGTQKDLLGGKGAGLAGMSKAGVPVPPGYTITTDTCRYYYANGKKLPKELAAQQKEAMALTKAEQERASIRAQQCGESKRILFSKRARTDLTDGEKAELKRFEENYLARCS